MPASAFTSPLYRAIIETLVAVRKEAAVRQVDLAARLGKPQSFVSKYENGERILDVAEYVAVARALGADPIELLQDCIARTGG